MLSRILLLKLIPYKALSKQIETTKIQTVIGLTDGVLFCHHTTVSGKGIHGYGKGDAGPVHPEHAGDKAYIHGL